MASATAPMGSTLVYDADCAFCRRCLDLGRRRLRRFPTAVGFQVADLDTLGVTDAQARHSIWLVSPGRRPRSGAAAVVAILMAQRQFGWRLAGAALSIPPIRWFAAAAYALIARNRQRLPGGSDACAASRPQHLPPRHDQRA